MKKYRFRLGAGAALLLAGAAASAQPAAPLSPEELYERLSPSVWMVETRMADGKGAQGSAVVIGPNTLITNCHVVANAAVIAVSHLVTNRKWVRADVQYRDPSRDLCQLRAPGIQAPAVEMGSIESLRVGAKVYAIGNPRGMELTLSDGLVSAFRRDGQGELVRVQISVPIYPGSSGGGLFDVHGRLVGITSGGRPDSQSINFAVPAEWIAQLAARSGGTVVAKVPEAAPQARGEPVAPLPPLPAPADRTVASPSRAAPAEAAPALAAGKVFVYRLQDRVTGREQTVVYRATRDGQGGDAAGGVGGDFDQAMPPGGWVPAGTQPGSTWDVRFSRGVMGQVVALDLHATAQPEALVTFRSTELRVIPIEFTGSTQRYYPGTNPSAVYKAVAWYAPQLGRVVRFKAFSHGGVGSGSFAIDEQLELVDIRGE